MMLMLIYEAGFLQEALSDPDLNAEMQELAAFAQDLDNVASLLTSGVYIPKPVKASIHYTGGWEILIEVREEGMVTSEEFMTKIKTFDIAGLKSEDQVYLEMVNGEFEIVDEPIRPVFAVGEDYEHDRREETSPSPDTGS